MKTIRRSGFGSASGIVKSMTEHFASRTNRRATFPRNGRSTTSFSKAPATIMSILLSSIACKIPPAGSSPR
jgi:hypothetical protein